MSRFADVIVPLPLDGTFTYAVPADLQGRVAVGCRVIVPFGARKFYTAIVMRLHDEEPAYETKELSEQLDERPLVLPQQLRLWEWIADYYLSTLGEVFKAALPSGLKLESESTVCLDEDWVADQPFTPSEEKVWRALSIKPEQTLAALGKETGLQRILPVVKGLLEKGAVTMKEELRRTYREKTVTCVRLAEGYFSEERLRQALDTLHRSPRQEELLGHFIELASVPAALALQNEAVLREVEKKALLEAAGSSDTILRELCRKNILETYPKAVDRKPHGAFPEGMLMHPLSPAQQQAYDEIQTQWQSHPVCLLHGVTSSGKTEVYIHLMQQAIDRGEQVLFMLPEIVLTAQLTDRLRRVFGNRLGVYHSRYPDAERVELYKKMLSDAPYDIVVGVRSSIFLPFQRLGLLIIDEEHETSFKQQDPAPRYHARNTALVLAAMMKARTLLGTATPSIETYHNAQQGKYGLVRLTTRYADVQLPNIEVVDAHEMRRKKMMTGLFTPQLLVRIRAALEQHQQVILFQNRRGYAPVMECKECGWTPRCQKCDVSLTVHRNQRQLICHYCGTAYAIPSRCPCCEGTQLSSQGYGTERIEEHLRELLPEARIARMDLDTTRSRQAYEQIISDFQHYKTDILIGTQMVTKGLDFDRVSLVGILSADSMLALPDFRAYERAYQMMEQVAGRAGRRGKQGHVILQTRDAGCEVVGQVVRHDYEGMYHHQLEERRLFCYPPFCRLFFVHIKHRQEALAERLAADMASLLRQVFGMEHVLGPDTPSVSRVQLLYIRQLILKVSLNLPLPAVRERLRLLRQQLLAQPQYKSAQLYFDVD